MAVTTLNELSGKVRAKAPTAAERKKARAARAARRDHGERERDDGAGGGSAVDVRAAKAAQRQANKAKRVSNMASPEVGSGKDRVDRATRRAEDYAKNNPVAAAKKALLLAESKQRAEAAGSAPGKNEARADKAQRVADKPTPRLKDAK